MSFVRDLEGISSLVVGAETPEQVLDNIKLLDGPKLTEDIILKLREITQSIPIEDIMAELMIAGRKNASK